MKADLIDEALESAMHRYLDGTADADSVANLNSRMRDDSGVRRHFSELANLDSALAELGAGWVPSTINVRENPAKVVTFPRRAWFAAAACLVLAAIAGWSIFQTRQPFATIASGSLPDGLQEGSELRDQPIELLVGTVEMATAKGARVVIEAPAIFHFSSAQTLHLNKGRLAADVPPSAKGFTVITPSGSAVDLGTTFGVDVPLSGEPEIHVFKGEVIAHPSDGKRRSLRSGDAWSLNSEASATRELRSSAFIRPDEIASLHAALASGQQARAEACVAAWRNDSDLIAALDFESDAVSAPEGTYRMVQGRWPGSQAAEFIHVDDHMKFNAGADRDWPQLTLAAWVRIDRLGAPYQSLLHTDGWTLEKPGQVHWMINRNATMRLALRGNTLASDAVDPDGYPDSLTPVLPEQGRWTHLAAVYDSDAATVRFYLNGKFDKETQQAVAHPAKLGPAQIGNWDQRDRKLSGRIDELLLIGRILNDAEMLELFESGNPYASLAP